MLWALNMSESRKLTVEPLKENESSCCTYVFTGEDHTLGNALRYVILKNQDVEFCGYSIPHPSDNKLLLRIQTTGCPPKEVLTKGLKTLHQTCDHVLKTFEEKVNDFVPQEAT